MISVDTMIYPIERHDIYPRPVASVNILLLGLIYHDHCIHLTKSQKLYNDKWCHNLLQDKSNITLWQNMSSYTARWIQYYYRINDVTIYCIMNPISLYDQIFHHILHDESNIIGQNYVNICCRNKPISLYE